MISTLSVQNDELLVNDFVAVYNYIKKSEKIRFYVAI